MPTAQGNPTVLSASGLVSTGRTRVIGVFCSASSAGTLKLWDNTAGSGAVLVDTFPLVAGTFYKIPVQAANGVFATIAGTSATVSVITQQGS